MTHLRRRRSARSYILEVVVTLAFLLLMIAVVLPALGGYMSDRAIEQFIASPTPSEAP